MTDFLIFWVEDMHLRRILKHLSIILIYLYRKMLKIIRKYLLKLKNKSNKLLYFHQRKTCIMGFASTVKSMITITKELLDRNASSFKFVQICNFFQDHIELFFYAYVVVEGLITIEMWLNLEKQSNKFCYVQVYVPQNTRVLQNTGFLDRPLFLKENRFGRSRISTTSYH